MFHSARLKLTAWYLCIIMTISVMFSAIIYSGLTSEINRFERLQRYRIERRFLDSKLHLPMPPPSMANPELLEETRHRVLIMLGIVNGCILILAGGLGYLLSGLTLKPIKNMVDEQNRFVGDASHELRTPLTSLKTAFEVYLRDKYPTVSRAKSLILESVDEVNKLQLLSDSLLTLATFENTKSAVVFETVRLNDVVALAVKKVKPVANTKHITISLKTTGVVVLGNKESLTQCIVILLDNALKYSAKKSKVDVLVGKNDGTAFVSVSDHGIGISRDDLPRIFDRFYRADSARGKSDAGGYGLGLSIARKIADTHNGKIEVKSVINKGSTFTIRLPVSFR